MTKVTNKEAKKLLSGVIAVLDMKPEDDIISIDDILNKVKADLENLKNGKIELIYMMKYAIKMTLKPS